MIITSAALTQEKLKEDGLVIIIVSLLCYIIFATAVVKEVKVKNQVVWLC